MIQGTDFLKRIAFLLVILGLIHSLSCVSLCAAKKNRAVLDAQTSLAQWGYNPGPIDGIMGKKTSMALWEFQKDADLTASGLLDEPTNELLNALLIPSEEDRQGADKKPVIETIPTSVSTPPLSITIGVSTVAIFLVVILLALICWHKVKKIENQPGDKTLRYFLFKNSLEFLRPFIIVSLLYFVLVVLVSYFSSFFSIQALLWIEQSLAKFKSYFTIFKLSPLGVFGILLVLYLLGLFLLPKDKTRKVFGIFDRYQKLIRRAYTILIFLCLFTLFGTQLGEPANQLKLQIKTIREGYADLVRESEEALTQAVADDLFDKVYDSFPQPYRNAIAALPTSGSKMESVSGRYRDAKSKHQIVLPALEQLEKQQKKRTRVVSRIKRANLIIERGIPRIRAIGPSPSADLSHLDIKKARSAVQQFKRNLKHKMITLLKAEGSKKVAFQPVKIGSSKLKSVLVRPIISAYPCLEPLSEFFFKTVDDTMENRWERKADRIVKSVVQNPKQAPETFKKEASQITGGKKIQLSGQTSQKAIQAGAQERKLMASIGNALKTIETEIKKKSGSRQADKLIVQLRSSNESGRIAASRRLAGMGKDLSKSQVDQIVHIMRTGRENWDRYYTKGSCRYLEKTSVKFYAADTLRNMKSPYVSQTIKREAVTTKHRSKTVKKVSNVRVV